MQIDIIIPCYNAHETLPRALASIAAQELVSLIKVTLVDDCSEHGYGDIVKAFSPLLDVQEIRMEENGGPGKARQFGLDETDGDFVMFADADDTLCDSFTVTNLLREIQKGYDVVGGEFIEQLEDGSYVVHREDMVWVFAKMYRRSFLDRFLIRFNDTRCNEDTGFNALVGALTDRVSHIRQTVYLWHWAPNTITRSNNGAYTYAHGHRGYVENMIWVVAEMTRRALNKELIRDFAVTVLCRLYFMHEEVKAFCPEEASASMETVRKFWRETYAPIRPFVPDAYLAEHFIEEQKRGERRFVPKITFRDFLKELDEK